MDAALRMIDANLNRAREALRTLEDVARFAWNDAELAARVKSLRHDLSAATSGLPAARLAAARDVAGDVGTSIEADGEYRRAGLEAVAAAAGARLSESLRVVEEAAKTLPPDGERLARAIEAIRYQAYAVAAQATLRAARGAPRQWRLCLLLTRALCRRPWEEVVRGAIAGGCDAIQVREKPGAAERARADGNAEGGSGAVDDRALDDRALVAHVEAVRAVAGAGCALVVNDRLDVALAAGADGVHLGTGDLPVARARRIAGPRFLIGASTHSLDEARAALDDGADHCGVGAMYATSLKPTLAPAGLAFLRAFLAAHPTVPHLAIGGIAPGRVAALACEGCRGVAVSSAICGAEDPEAVARAIVDELESAGPAAAGDRRADVGLPRREHATPRAERSSP